jgi:hypothetical protein
MTIKQIIHGYCDANVYGVVVRFTLTGGKEYGAYVDFDRRTGQINLPTTISDDDSGKHKCPMPKPVVAELEKHARVFAGTALPHVN